MIDSVSSCQSFVYGAGLRFALVSTGFNNVAHIIQAPGCAALCRAQAKIVTTVSDRRVCPKCLKVLQSMREGIINA